RVVNGRILARAIPGATLHVVPAGGHLFLLEQPAAIAALVAEFLTSPQRDCSTAGAKRCGEVDVPVQDVGVGDGGPVDCRVRSDALQQSLDRHFELLAGQGHRYCGYLDDVVRDVAGRDLLADGGADSSDQVVSQLGASRYTGSARLRRP
ncbi:MAG: TAP-like protein, partial [Pseudonocardiales bacterium]|nr:TAP-like protein [Pseudonocardiales bacterium]